MKRITVFSVVSLFTLATFIYAQEIPLRLTLTSDKKVYETGENINVIAKLENINDEKIWVTTIPRWGEDICVLTTKIKGDMRLEAEVWELKKTYPILLKEYFHTLNKGESIKSSENVLRWTGTLDPGIYEISVYYKIAPKRLKVQDGLIWTGRVDSDPITIEIVEKKR